MKKSRRSCPEPHTTSSRVSFLLWRGAPFAGTGKNVRGDQVEIVVRPVKVRRHRGDEVRAVLAAVGLAEFDARDLGDCVGLVGRLERAGKERALGNRLRRVLRINAGAAEKQKFANPRVVSSAQDIVLEL